MAAIESTIPNVPLLTKLPSSFDRHSVAAFSEGFQSRANCRTRWRTGSLRVWSEEMALSHSDCGWSWSRRK